MRIQEVKIELQKKVCVREITSLGARIPSYVIYYRFFCQLPPFRLLRFYIEKKPCDPAVPRLMTSIQSIYGITEALLKKRLQHRYFPVNFAKSLRTTF